MYTIGMEIDLKDMQNLGKAIDRAKIKETVTVEMMERKFQGERDDYELIISKFEREIKRQREEHEKKEKSLLGSYRTQLIAVKDYKKNYKTMKKNFETQKETIKKLQAVDNPVADSEKVV